MNSTLAAIIASTMPPWRSFKVGRIRDPVE